VKNIAQNTFYVALTAALMGVQNVLAAIDPNRGQVNQGIVTEGSAEVVIQVWIERLLGFLYIVAVVYALWGGFNILTAAGEDDKVGTGKKIIIQALIGIAVIFLAGSIVQFVIGSILGA
jgi:hypothetical protein